MAIILKDNFCFFELYNGCTSLIIDNRIDEIVDYVNSHDIDSVTIQPMLHDIMPYKGMCKYLLTDVLTLDFLKRMPSLTKVRLIDVNSCNASGLYYLKNLTHLTVSNANNNPRKNIRIDFRKFERLTELNTDWFSEGFNVSSNNNLKFLCVRKYCSTTKNFTELQLPKHLTNLEIIQSNIKNFMGIKCSELKNIEISYCAQLSSLDGISAIASKLNSLIVENARSLTDYESIKSCRLLQNVVLVSCGNIATIEWVKHLPELSRFILDKTTVIDGDMRGLMSVDNVIFTNKSHYNCKCIFSLNGVRKYKIIPVNKKQLLE